MSKPGVRRRGRIGAGVEEAELKRMGEPKNVIAGIREIEGLVGVKVGEKKLLGRIGEFWRNEKGLSGEEMARLQDAAEWTSKVAGALGSGSTKKMDKVA